MEKQFVTYEIALKLKELGFDEVCLAVYFKNKFQLVKGFNINNVDLHVANQMDAILAPLWQQIIDFFIEKYGLHIVITVNPYSEIKEVNGYKIYSEDEDLKCIVNQETQSWSKYKAHEQAILKAIELCKKEK